MGVVTVGRIMGDMIFKPAARYPADPRAVFILALSVFGGATALAIDAAPQSLEALVPRWGVLLWGILLVVGSLTTLVGMAFQSLNGIIIEQVGCVTVGVTTSFYSILALWVVGEEAMQPIITIFAWGVACLIRWAQLQRLIRTAYREQIRREIFAEIDQQDPES